MAGLAMLAQPAMAQQADAPIQRVEITGSAIKRIDGETSVPITILKMDDLRKQGITTIEQVMSNLSASQASQGTSQVVGLGTGGASFADLRGIGANKTLVLLNGRRLANNALDSSAPDLNMIPFAALERVEVLRDGASSLYGSDAVGGVINFITRKDFQGGIVSVGADMPEQSGGFSNSANIGFGYGDLEKDGFNIFAMLDHQSQRAITGTQRPYNTRFPGGLSPTTSPANYYQDGKSGNPSAPSCASGTFLIPLGSGCQMTTSSFVDYVPKSERTTGLIKGTLKINANHELSLEYLGSESKVYSHIAPVPYGGLYQNRTRLDGSLNPFFPGNGNFTPNIPLSSTYTEDTAPAGAKPGFVHVKWRDLPNGSRSDENINKQQRLVAALTGNIAGWDYNAALTYNENKVKVNLKGYSDGSIITNGVLNGIINPFGDQDAAGMALIQSAALDGNVQNAKGSTKGADFNASRELSDWLGAGRSAALAIGGQATRENFLSTANFDYASKVVASTGIDPELHNEGSRNTQALYAELNVPIIKTLDVTAAVRYDRYSDFGNTTNPKVAFRFQPSKEVLLRGSYSTGFRAPSLYEINSAQTYTNTSQHDDPINCPGGAAQPGKPEAANCSQQFQALYGGNKNLQPEKSKNATFGIVIEPLNNLSVGIDLWAIKLDHSIGSLSEDDVFADPATYAAVFHRTASGNLATDGSQCPNPATCGYVDLRTQNLGGVKTRGIDLSVNYRLRTNDFGTLALVTNSTYVNKYEYQSSEGGEWKQNVGVYSGTGPVFRWQHNVTLNWNSGIFSGGMSGHYKSGYIDQDPEFNVASYTTFDAFAGVAATKNVTLTAGVRNLFDRAPPLSYQTTTFQAGYDPRYADAIGRTVYVRGSYKF
ncbi:TonB-dependent receptor [Janthinobacterium sp. HLX7-2]|uniref:TonB-dependent receptor n=1 Tax=Janthinobacterium sp. HLX7-2 TaxID=1259331 RepID=UPI003F29C1D5